MINHTALIAKIIEESQKLPPVVKLADELFMAGLREEDVNWRLMSKKTPAPAMIQFRNRLRDLEKGFRKPGEKE